MIFTETRVPGVFRIEPENLVDERGFLARSFCTSEFAKHGLNPHVAQCNISFNPTVDTLRGLHYQVAPHAEARLVRCTRGAIFDVAVDLRPGSATFRQWVGFELAAETHAMLYVPAGVAHGFQTLRGETEVFYQMSAPYDPQAARGVRWDDPAFGVAWPPARRRIISKRDATYPDFTL
jgi:dTDP-4-dehydrorhamnose 3,5-epimerase